MRRSRSTLTDSQFTKWGWTSSCQTSGQDTKQVNRSGMIIQWTNTCVRHEIIEWLAKLIRIQKMTRGEYTGDIVDNSKTCHQQSATTDSQHPDDSTRVVYICILRSHRQSMNSSADSLIYPIEKQLLSNLIPVHFALLVRKHSEWLSSHLNQCSIRTSEINPPHSPSNLRLTWLSLCLSLHLT